MSCHTNPVPGEQMTFPTTTTCMGCHAGIATDRPAIQRLTQYARSHQAIAWVRLYSVISVVFQLDTVPAHGCYTC